MKRLFLTSSFTDVAQHFPKFLDDSPEGKSATFIITAGIPEEYTGYIDNDREAFEKLGITIDELNVAEKTEEEIADKINKNDFIYVSGGNTFYLLQELKKSKADQLLESAIHTGKIYIGASAGSMVLSPDISYVEAIDDKTKAPDLTDNIGLNIVPFYTLPHYKSEPFEAVMDEVLERYKDELPLLPISNTQVITVRGGAYRNYRSRKRKLIKNKHDA